MRILFDQGTPAPLRSLLSDLRVETASERGWTTLTNGELLTEAERAGFEILVTIDQNLRYQHENTCPRDSRQKLSSLPYSFSLEVSRLLWYNALQQVIV